MRLASDDLLQLAWTQAWQLAVLAVAIAVVVKLACRRRPHLAYLLWMLVIIKAITPPVWSSPTGAFSWAMKETIAERTLSANVPNAPAPLAFTPVEKHPPSTSAGPPSVTLPTPAPTPQPAASVSIGSILLIGWCAGSLGLAMLVLVRWIALLRQLRRRSQPASAALGRQFDALRQQLGLRRPVRLVVTTDNLGPAAFGWWRGTVLVPQAVVEQSQANELAAILAHELVHLRRFDPLAGSLQLLVQCLWWFHPAVWWANRQIRVERERSCDEEVLAELPCPPADYARLLVRILQWRQQFVPAVFWSGMRSWDVTSARLRHVLEGGAFRRRAPRWCWLVGIAGLAVALPGAGLRMTAADPPQPATNAASAPIKPDLTHLEKFGLKVQSYDDGKKQSLTIQFEPSFRGRDEALPLGDLPTVSYIYINEQLNLSNDQLVAQLKAVRDLRPETTLFVGFKPDQGTAFSLLREIPRLERLAIISDLPKLSTGATGRTVSVGDLRGLRFLMLGGNLTEEEINELAPLSGLEELQLNPSKPLETRDLAGLENKPKLARLTLANIQPNDASLATIGRMAALENLHLNIESATDAGVAHLAGLTRLKILNLDASGGKSRVTPDGLEVIGRLPQLTGLAMFGKVSPRRVVTEGGVSDQVIAGWINGITNLHTSPGLKNLRSLQLFDCELQDHGMLMLSKLPALKQLILIGDVRLTDRGRRALGTMTGLRRLVLNDTQLSDEGLLLLKDLTGLEALSLIQASQLTDAGLAPLADFKNLYKLVIRESKLSGKGLAALARLTKLETLALAQNPIDDSGVAAIGNLGGLRDLNLAETNITDRAMELISQDLPQLVTLNIDGTQVTNDGLAMLKSLKHLRSVQARNSKVSETGRTLLSAEVDTGIGEFGEMELFSLDIEQ